MDFLCYKEITFASVGTTTDKLVLPQTWENVNMPATFYVDLQDLYKIKGSDKAGMAVMAAELIDPWYAKMKERLHHNAHRDWEVRPLPEANKKYATIDAYVAFELYRVILEKQAAGEPVGYQPGSDDSDSDGTEDSSDDESVEDNKRRKRA